MQEYLDKKEKDETKQLRRANIKALADILDGMEQVSHRTTWANTQRLLIENPAFTKDSSLQSELRSAQVEKVQSRGLNHCPDSYDRDTRSVLRAVERADGKD